MKPLSSSEIRIGNAVSHIENPARQATIISDSKGRFVYVVPPFSHTVQQYRVAANGLLEPLLPPTVSVPDAPARMILPSNGNFLYLVNRSENKVSQMRRGIDGTLHPVRVFQFGGLNSYTPVAITPNGRFMYVSEGAYSDIKQYAINRDGQLYPLLPSKVVFNPWKMESSTKSTPDIVVDLNSRFLYAVYSGGYNQILLQSFRISESGTLLRVKGNPIDFYGSEMALTFARPH